MSDADRSFNDQTMDVAPASNLADVLLHIEVPVSISLGRTRMTMKELVSLTPGSVVELNESVGDEVQILVNKSVLAHGEVVAIDGNYGVRITRMAGQMPAAMEPSSLEPAGEP